MTAIEEPTADGLKPSNKRSKSKKSKKDQDQNHDQGNGIDTKAPVIRDDDRHSKSKKDKLAKKYKEDDETNDKTEKKTKKPKKKSKRDHDDEQEDHDSQHKSKRRRAEKSGDNANAKVVIVNEDKVQENELDSKRGKPQSSTKPKKNKSQKDKLNDMLGSEPNDEDSKPKAVKSKSKKKDKDDHEKISEEKTHSNEIPLENEQGNESSSDSGKDKDDGDKTDEEKATESRAAFVTVRNIPSGSKKKDVREALQSCGKIISVRLDPSMYSAVVRFESVDQANAAVSRALRHELTMQGSELRIHKAQEDERSKRTVFVGNVAAVTKRKDLKKLFSQVGPVESVRIRSVTPQKFGMPKKVAAISLRLHENRDTVNAYVVFQKEEDAVKSLSKLNSHLLNGLHLRVDTASQMLDQNNYQRSVFVGNLPFDATEEKLRKVFEQCGSSISYVRLIRDELTGMGKGFGYVCFEDKLAVPQALLMNDRARLDKRRLRVMKCSPALAVKAAGEKEVTKRRRDWRVGQGGQGGRDYRDNRDNRDNRDGFARSERPSRVGGGIGIGVGVGSKAGVRRPSFQGLQSDKDGRQLSDIHRRQNEKDRKKKRERQHTLGVTRSIKKQRKSVQDKKHMRKSMKKTNKK